MPWWPLREGKDGKCEGRIEKCEFLARESVSSSPIVRIFDKGKCKFIANFSATMVTSLPSFSLSLSLYLSLSLSPKVPHAQYRKRFRASYNYVSCYSVIIQSAEALPTLCVRSEREREIQRERERERERRKWRHLSSAEIGEEFCTFLAKILHLSFSTLKWRRVHTFRCQNVALFETVRIFCKFALFTIVLPLSNGVTGDRSTEKKKNDLISGCTVLLLIKKMNQINTKNYWK